jgi:hypothetical protein
MTLRDVNNSKKPTTAGSEQQQGVNNSREPATTGRPAGTPEGRPQL